MIGLKLFSFLNKLQLFVEFLKQFSIEVDIKVFVVWGVQNFDQTSKVIVFVENPFFYFCIEKIPFLVTDVKILQREPQVVQYRRKDQEGGELCIDSFQ